MITDPKDPLAIHDKLAWGDQEIAACGAGTWGKAILASTPVHTTCSKCLDFRHHNLDLDWYADTEGCIKEAVINVAEKAFQQ